MYPELREERIHGTKEFPFSCYHLHDMPAFFQIPVHWHPEVEIIYVRSGSLNVIIEGEEYEAAGGSVFFVNPGELHFRNSGRRLSYPVVSTGIYFLSDGRSVGNGVSPSPA